MTQNSKLSAHPVSPSSTTLKTAHRFLCTFYVYELKVSKTSHFRAKPNFQTAENGSECSSEEAGEKEVDSGNDSDIKKVRISQNRKTRISS